MKTVKSPTYFLGFVKIWQVCVPEANYFFNNVAHLKMFLECAILKIKLMQDNTYSGGNELCKLHKLNGLH